VSVILLARGRERLEAAAAAIRAEHGVDAIALVADMADVKLQSFASPTDAPHGAREADVKLQSFASPTDAPHGARKAEFEGVIAQVSELGQDVGLFVYNAAFAPIGPFADQTAPDLARAVAVNVNAPLLLAKALAGPMIQRGSGGIVLMSSLAGGQGSPHLATYAATKSFNAILAEGLWRELRPHGVDVLACCAGAIMTPGYREAAQGRPAPGSLPPAAVAEAALAPLGHGPIVVPGAVNKIGRFALTRLLPRRGAIALMAKNTGGLT
jgi:short-subunit dehydrogenase